MAELDIDRIVQQVVEKVLSGQGVAASAGQTPDTTSRNMPVNLKDDVRRVAIGSDAKGLPAKNAVRPYLESCGYVVTDVGGNGDYPDIAHAVAKKVASGDFDRGVMFDGDGIGSSIVCNKVRGIRAALCYDMRSIVNSREHINANVLTLGGPFHSGGELCEMVRTWLECRFPSGERWSTLNKMKAIERSQWKG
jgi:ribose 5-phosphate isomerase B